MWNLENKNKYKNRFTYIEIKLVDTQWGEGKGEGYNREKGINCLCKISKLQGNIVQYSEYSQYFIITLN